MDVTAGMTWDKGIGYGCITIIYVSDVTDVEVAVVSTWCMGVWTATNAGLVPTNTMAS